MGGGNETRIGLELLLSAYVDEHWRAREPDQTGELSDGDSGRRGHGGVHLG